MSVWTKAMSAAKSAVSAPTIVTVAIAAGARLKRYALRATR